MNEIPMTGIPKSPMVIGSAIPATHYTMVAVSPDSELLAQVKLLSAKVERLEAVIEGLKELAGMHQDILEEIENVLQKKILQAVLEQSHGRPN